MVFFAISRGAFESYISLGLVGTPLWVSAGVISGEELATLRAGGIDVSNFNFTLELVDSAGIEGAVETIREHYPCHTVWVGR